MGVPVNAERHFLENFAQGPIGLLGDWTGFSPNFLTRALSSASEPGIAAFGFFVLPPFNEYTLQRPGKDDGQDNALAFVGFEFSSQPDVEKS